MSLNLAPEHFTPKYQNFKIVKELTERFNRGDLDYLPKKDLEQVAMLAAQYGTDFRPKSKPVRKALFDFVDMAAFGLVPNKWRPESIGEEYFGESGWDKFAGGVGSLGGLGTGIYGLYKGASKAKGLLDTWRGGSSAASAGNKMAQLNSSRDSIMLGSGAKRLPDRPNLLQLGSGDSERIRNLRSLISDEADLIAGF
tara:strand:+ start:4159 stop:4749 length:591 start_codon:yes stop_codon:yes gene_type:complete